MSALAANTIGTNPIGAVRRVHDIVFVDPSTIIERRMSRASVSDRNVVVRRP